MGKSKRGKWCLKGQLVGEPGKGFCNGSTRREIRKIVLAYGFGEEPKEMPFDKVKNFEVKEDGEFMMRLRGPHSFAAGDGPNREEAIEEMLIELQEHFSKTSQEKGSRRVLDVLYIRDFDDETEE